jgi:plasmid maintenance system antidote protein VapI
MNPVVYRCVSIVATLLSRMWHKSFSTQSSEIRRLLQMERAITIENAVELGYNVMKRTECFVRLLTIVALTEECNAVVNREELIGTTEYLTPWAKYCINPFSL